MGSLKSIYFFNKNLLPTFCVPSTVVGTKNKVFSIRENNPSHGVYIPGTKKIQ